MECARKWLRSCRLHKLTGCKEKNLENAQAIMEIEHEKSRLEKQLTLHNAAVLSYLETYQKELAKVELSYDWIGLFRGSIDPQPHMATVVQKYMKLGREMLKLRKSIEQLERERTAITENLVSAKKHKLAERKKTKELTPKQERGEGTPRHVKRSYQGWSLWLSVHEAKRELAKLDIELDVLIGLANSEHHQHNNFAMYTPLQFSGRGWVDFHKGLTPLEEVPKALRPYVLLKREWNFKLWQWLVVLDRSHEYSWDACSCST